MTTIHNRLVSTGPLFRQAQAGQQGPGFIEPTPAPKPAKPAPAAAPAAATCRCADIAPALQRLEAAIAALLIDVADLRRRIEASE